MGGVRAAIFRVPQRLSDRPAFPPQALGVVCRFLRNRGIDIAAYDIRDLLGSREVSRLR